jgi:hypothetical protein
MIVPGFIVLLIVAVMIMILALCSKGDVQSVVANDGNTYIIRRGHNKSMEFLQESANVLSKLNQRILELINYLRMHSPDEPSAKALARIYNYTVLSEAVIDSRYTSFTVNKKDIHMCIRTRNSEEQVYDIDLLMYVVLHELAHMCNYDSNGVPIVGHGPEFKHVFRLFVESAVRAGVYKYTDYSDKPTEYCGMILNSSIL